MKKFLTESVYETPMLEYCDYYTEGVLCASPAGAIEEWETGNI